MIMTANLKRVAHLVFTLRNLVDALDQPADVFGRDARLQDAMYYARSALLLGNAVVGEAEAIVAITSGK